MKKTRISWVVRSLILSMLFAVAFFGGTASADQDLVVPGKNYVLPENSNFSYENQPSTDTFFYGASSLGSLRLSGSVSKITSYDGRTAYGVTGPISIRYAYDGSYRYTKPEEWHIEGDGTRWIRMYDVGLLNNIGQGCIMLERSTDGSNWEKVIDPIKNYFNQAKTASESLIYTIPESEIKNGMFYRLVVAYKFAKKTGNDNDVRKCVEAYEFYVASEDNYITFISMEDGKVLPDQGTTSVGFQIKKNGSNATVKIRGRDKVCNDFDYFTEPGEYVVDITTTLGNEYSSTITVTEGVNFTELTPTAYVSEKDKGFPLDQKADGTAFGGFLTSLSLVTPKGIDIVNVQNNYGIKGKSLSLYMKLNKDMDDLGLGWRLNSDSWGKNTNDQIFGINSGAIGKGALMILLSKDGQTWTQANRGRYANGLYTTDYATYYGKAENVMIYTPSGEDIINGVHIQVLFAYQIYNKELNTYLDYIEKYQFYLCNNELGAVTFHNLSVADTLAETFTDADQNTLEVYSRVESLESGSYTTSGFRIDKTLNPTVDCTVLRNGNPVDKDQYIFAATGRYDISLKSKVGSSRTLTIYVDRNTPEESMKAYFGKGFLSGKRIYAEGGFPVYEGGETTFFVSKQNEDVLPLYGEIRNEISGNVIAIEQNREEKTGIITEAGQYKAVFSTSKDYFTGNVIGDAKVFTFQFNIIQQGTAPGPMVNQSLLEEYRHTTVSDSNPVYYGLTYSSAEKGHITLAFANEEDAKEYAYNYEKGTVEPQGNGAYRYTGSFLVDQKTEFNSAWDLTDAVNYFAEAAVHKHYFDMSDEFTYLSLSPETLEKTANLRKLELPKSVTVFADGQKEKLTDIDTLPMLNDKIYAYLNPETGEVDRGFTSFEFITDQYGGIDSSKVTITDSQGVKHSVRYGESVGQQLLADHCSTGIVTIREETRYGDSSEYKAVYIAPDDNTTTIKLSYKGRGTAGKADGNKQHVVVDSFSISEVNDPLDPYALIIVKHNQNEEIFTAKDILNKEWDQPGNYTITCVNRAGYGYMIPITVENNKTNNNTEKSLEFTKQSNYAMDVMQIEEDGNSSREIAENTEEAKPQPSPDQNAEEQKPTATEQITAPENEQNNNNNGSLLIYIVILAALIPIVAFVVYNSRKNKKN